MSREIRLTKGRSAVVDDDDFERLATLRWSFSGRGSRGVGYAVRRCGPRGSQRTIYMHRLVLGDPAGQVDHINGDRLDNRRANLRVCSPSENRRNTGLSARNTSGFIGVTRDKRAWAARLNATDAKGRIGSFKTAIEAARAYDLAATAAYGEFARLNFPAHRDWLFPHEHPGVWPPAPS